MCGSSTLVFRRRQRVNTASGHFCTTWSLWSVQRQPPAFLSDRSGSESTESFPPPPANEADRPCLLL